MHQDNFTDTLSSEDQPPRRSFGGLGRGPAALLLTAGLLIGGGVGGFVVANAAAPNTPSASAGSGGPPPCPNRGGPKANCPPSSPLGWPTNQASLPRRLAHQGEPSSYPA